MRRSISLIGFMTLLFLLILPLALAVNSGTVVIGIEPNWDHVVSPNVYRYYENEPIVLNVTIQPKISGTIDVISLKLSPTVSRDNLNTLYFYSGATKQNFLFRNNFISNQPHTDSLVDGKYYRWLMYGTKSTAVLLTDKKVVGQITAKAGTAGTGAITLDLNDLSKNDVLAAAGTWPVRNTIEFQPVTIEVVAERCGDDVCSTSETAQTCAQDCGCQRNLPSYQCAGTQICYDMLCRDDTDVDNVPDELELPGCRTAFPNVYRITGIYIPSSVNFLGCLLGDISEDNILNDNDINPFIIKYRQFRGQSQVTSRADMDQGGEVNDNDINPFIIQYRLNNRRGN